MDVCGSLSALGLERRQIAGKGYGLVSQKHFERGAVLLDTPPLGIVFNGENTACWRCFSSAFTVKRCGGCRWVGYCNRECQKEDWTTHKDFCKLLKACSREVEADVLMLAQVLLSRESASSLYKAFQILPSHRDDYSQQSIQHFERVVEIAFAQIEKAGLSLNGVTKEEAVKYLCTFGCNNFSVSDEDLFAVGEGTFPFGSLINHSCQPNSVVMYLDGRQVVRAIENIGPGEEITIAYIDTAHPHEQRRKRLVEKYFFECSCPCCVDPLVRGCERFTAGLRRRREGDGNGGSLSYPKHKQMVALDEFLWSDLGWLSRRADSILLSSDDGGVASFYDSRYTWALEWSKEHCEDPQADGDGERNVEEILRQIAGLENGTDEREIVNRWRNALQLRYDIMHPLHVDHIAPLNRLMNLYVAMNQWDEAIPCCKHVLLIYSFLYPPSHPMVGLQWLTLAKLLWNGLHTEEAQLALTQAKRCLLQTHSVPSLRGEWKGIGGFSPSSRYHSTVLASLTTLEKELLYYYGRLRETK